MGYDAWLELPYQRAAEQAEAERCPECDEQTLEDDGEGVECQNPDCDYRYYRDFDSEPGGADWEG